MYAFGSGALDRLEVSEHSRTKMLRIKRSGQPFGRAMLYLGSHEFHPTGAPSVRIMFGFEGERAASVTVLDAQLVVAGTAWGGKHISYLNPDHATGYGVRLLTRWILAMAE